MKNSPVITAATLAGCLAVSHAQIAVSTQTVTTSPERTAPLAAAVPASGLSDLEAMTFGCPKAGLNAAAREAAAVPSQGTYQFAYFKIISDSHHASYEVHFKSNYVGEPDLKYCVAVYCQQGWDPKTTKTKVKLIENQRRPAGVTHGDECGHKPPAVKPRPRR